MSHLQVPWDQETGEGASWVHEPQPCRACRMVLPRATRHLAISIIPHYPAYQQMHMGLRTCARKGRAGLGALPPLVQLAHADDARYVSWG
jgi:hypothetical protein